MIRLSRSREVDLSSKRRHVTDSKLTSSVNGEINSVMKRHKCENKTIKSDIIVQPTRLQPHRAARYTESYSSTSSPDVILLSDDENKNDGQCSDSESSDSDCEMLPMSPPKELSDQELIESAKEVRSLQVKLCNEEIKLLLLKKLKHSQTVKEKKRETYVSSAPFIKSYQKVSLPLYKEPLLTSSSVVSGKQLPLSNKYQLPSQNCSKVIPPSCESSPINNINQSHTFVKPGLTVQPASSAVQSTGIPLKTAVTEMINQTSVNSISTTSVTSDHAKKKDIETVLQRQAAAKLALRKQLEKTLLMIPPPKPLPAQFCFIPNPNSTEFVCLLGLDVVVNFLTKTNHCLSFPEEPFSCIQCKTNFTTSWKLQEPKKNTRKKNALCEACTTSNLKKALKAEHTSHLKTAFVKALQQEKEIERLSHSFSLPPSISVVPVYTNSNGNSSSSLAFNNSSSSLKTSQSSKTSFHGRDEGFIQQFHKLSPQLQSILQAQTHSLIGSGMPLSTQIRPPLVPQHLYQTLGKVSSGQMDLHR